MSRLESTLRDLLNLNVVRLDRKLRSLIEGILDELKDGKQAVRDGLDDLQDVDSILRRRDDLLSDLLDLDLRELLNRIEARIEALLEELVRLLQQLRRDRKDAKKCPPDLRKRLIRLLLALLNLLHLRDLLKKLLSKN